MNKNTVIVTLIATLIAIVLIKVSSSYINVDLNLGIVFLIILTSMFIFINVMKYPKLRIVLISAFLLRIGMAFIYTLGGDSDPDGYGMRALIVYEGGSGEIFENYMSGAYIYSWFIGILYTIFGVNAFAIRLLNAFLSTLIVKNIYILGKELYTQKIAKQAAIIVAFYPTLIRFSAPFASRETLLVYLMTEFLILTYYYHKTNNILFIILALPLFYIGVELHTSMVFIGLVLFLIWREKIRKSRKVLFIFLGNICSIGGIGFVLLMVTKYGFGMEKLFLNQGGLGVEKIKWLQDSSAIGGAAYLRGVSSSNPIISLLILPVRMIYFLFSPFIWMVRKPIHIFGLIDGVILIILIKKAIYSYKFMRNNWSKKNNIYIKCIMISLTLLVLMFGSVVSNFGTALRHRSKLVPLIVLLSSPAFFIKKKKLKYNFRRKNNES